MNLGLLPHRLSHGTTSGSNHAAQSENQAWQDSRNLGRTAASFVSCVVSEKLAMPRAAWKVSDFGPNTPRWWKENTYIGPLKATPNVWQICHPHGGESRWSHESHASARARFRTRFRTRFRHESRQFSARLESTPAVKTSILTDTWVDCT